MAEEFQERLSSLPRTPQSHAMEIAESAPPAPPAPEPEAAPVPVRKTASMPKVIPRKPEPSRPAPVLKMGPEIPAAPAPPSPSIAPPASAPEELVAKVSRGVPEIDADSLLDDPGLDLIADHPTRSEALAATAESIRRSLLEDGDDDKTGGELAKLEKKPEAPILPTPLIPEPKAAPVSAPPPTASSPSPVSSAPAPSPTKFNGGMTGALFERFVHHAMTLGMTAVIATKPKAPSLFPDPAKPDLETTPSVADTLAAPALPELDPEDDVPDYVKAARKLTEPLEGFPALPEDHSPPGLNDFVISATHQTDFDMASSSITFAGHVVVESSRFHLTCDKFIVHMLPEQKGMEYGEALGNVVIRMMDAGKPTGHTGLARSAIYRPDAGEIILSGWPRIVEETKELVGITADAKMILSTSGSVRTVGRNRTILKQ